MGWIAGLIVIGVVASVSLGLYPIAAAAVVGAVLMVLTGCMPVRRVYDHIDWQVWIADGPQPLLRKIVITFKDEPQSPQFSATIRKWDLAPRLSPQIFVFDPPEGAREIEFIPSGATGEHR